MESTNKTPKIFESEYRFCLILWENEPIKSSELAKLCKEKLGWSRTTTYTVIKRLSERNVVKNENTIITSIVSKEEAQNSKIDELVEKNFNDSIPEFISAFTKHQVLTKKDKEEILKMIEDNRWFYEIFNCRFFQSEHSGLLDDNHSFNSEIVSEKNTESI